MSNQSTLCGRCLHVVVANGSFGLLVAAQPGKVEATADPVTDLQTFPTAIQASANSGSLNSAASRVLGTIDGAVSTPSFTDLRIPMVAGGASQFTVVGLQGVVPLSFNWTLTGSHA